MEQYYLVSKDIKQQKLIMKNLYLISTDTTQNIYITNSEQIILNDYITDGYSVWKWKDDSSLLGIKKVILTTDPTLIADNLQAIDDDFLEWFVKNPTCEEVFITDDYEQVDQDNPVLRGSTNLVHKYKIILKPKYTNQKLWDMAKVITKKQKAATEIDLSKVDWNMLEETWFDWLYQELIENN
jgi:hypothetical protein